MKMRKRARLMKQHQLARFQALFEGTRPHVGPVLRRRIRFGLLRGKVRIHPGFDALTADEEAFLSGITTPTG